MSAQQLMSRMLDELMGTRRNGEDSHKETLDYSDTRVCKSFLLSCCPHEILANTRFNIGKCPKVHDVALKADFEKSREHEYEFQIETHQMLDAFIVECKRRTKIAKLRLATAQDALNSKKAKQQNCVQQIDEEITEKISETEKLGAVGDVEGALKLMEEVEALKKEKAKISTDVHPACYDQQKKLRICEVCSSYLGMDDGDKRLADHFTGKLHVGFLYIREKYKELQELIQERCIKDVLENEFRTSAENLKRCQSSLLEAAGESSSTKKLKTDAETSSEIMQLNLKASFPTDNELENYMLLPF